MGISPPPTRGLAVEPRRIYRLRMSRCGQQRKQQEGCGFKYGGGVISNLSICFSPSMNGFIVTIITWLAWFVKGRDHFKSAIAGRFGQGGGSCARDIWVDGSQGTESHGLFDLGPARMGWRMCDFPSGPNHPLVHESLGTGTRCARERRELVGEDGLGHGRFGGCLDRLVD